MGSVQGSAESALSTTELDTPIGCLQLASSEDGLCYIGLPHASGGGLQGFAARHFRGVRRVAAFAPLRNASRQLLEYLEGKRRAFTVPLDCRGTEFQQLVWAELREIPYGETRSYGELARRIERPGSARAVGAANGANPLALVIPCHRVVEAGGGIGGYAGGVPLKKRLLAMERAALGGEAPDALL